MLAIVSRMRQMRRRADTLFGLFKLLMEIIINTKWKTMKKVVRIKKRTITKALTGTFIILFGAFYVLAGGLPFPSDSVSRLVKHMIPI